MLHFALVEIFPAAVFLLPLYLLLYKCHFYDIRKTAVCFLFSFYLCAVYALVGLPNITYIRLDISGNLIPFRDMLSGLKSSIQNVLLFVPLGIFLPVLRERYRNLKPTVCFGFSMSLAVELMQIFTYRATDVNDLITNTVGTLLGWAVWFVFQKKASGCGINKQQISLVFLSSLGIMFFLQPLVVALL